MNTPAKPDEGELKPCPFCGSKPLVEQFGDQHKIGCDNRLCGALPCVTVHENFGGFLECAERWNERPSSARTAQCAEVVNELIRNGDNDAWAKTIRHKGATVLVEFYDDGDVVVGMIGAEGPARSVNLTEQCAEVGVSDEQVHAALDCYVHHMERNGGFFTDAMRRVLEDFTAALAGRSKEAPIDVMKIVGLCHEIQDAAKRRETKSGGTIMCAEIAGKILAELRQEAPSRDEGDL